MARFSPRMCGAIVCALILPIVSSAAQAALIAPSAWGKGNDFTDPLDGIADEVVVSTSTIDLSLDSDGSMGSVEESRGILEFSIPAVVTSALLQFTIFGPVTGTVDVFSYSGDGSLGIADYAETGNLIASPTLVSANFSLDVTSAVQAALLGGESTIGFLIAVTAEDQLLSYHNVGHGTPDPQLEVVPEPSSLSLLLMGCALLASSRQRRR